MRCDLNVGERLVYRGTERSAGTEVVDLSVDVWVLARESRVATVLIETADASAVFMVDARGQCVLHDAFASDWPRVAPLANLFIETPRQASAVDRWVTARDRFGGVWACRARFRSETAIVTAEYQDAAPGSAILTPPRSAEYRLADGRVQSATVEALNADGARVVRKLELVHVVTNDSAWTARERVRVERIVDVMRSEARLRGLVTRAPQRIDTVITDLNRIWSELAHELGDASGPAERFVRSRRARWNRAAPRLRAQAAFAQRWLGERAPAYTLTSLTDGAPTDSETTRTIRGRTVEVFISRSQPIGWRLLSWLTTSPTRNPLDPCEVAYVALACEDDPLAAQKMGAAIRASSTSPWRLVAAGAYCRALNPPELPLAWRLDSRGRVTAIEFGWVANSETFTRGD